MLTVGRKRKHNLDMPARVYLSRGWWFFVPKGASAIKLAKADDKPGALRAYAEIMEGGVSESVNAMLDRYRNEVLIGKAPKTQQVQEFQIEKLRAVFGAMSLAAVRPEHVAEYLDRSDRKVSANREIALLSHVFTKAMRWGKCDANPCRGVERNKERPRNRYIAHDEFIDVMECATPAVQVMMALAYVTGQREGDLLRLTRAQIQENGIAFTQRKTGKRLVVSWTQSLVWCIEQAGKLPTNGIHSLFVVCQRNGQPYSESGFQTIWQRHIRDCHKSGVIAERFTFHDIRAKAGSDGKDGRLLGHMDPRTLRRIYMRKPELVSPTS